MGPIIMPELQIAIIRACCEGLLMSIIAAWLSGPMKAPEIPCNDLKATICSMFCAIPHNIDVPMKLTTASRNSGREPIRSASQPVMGIVTAEATI